MSEPSFDDMNHDEKINWIARTAHAGLIDNGIRGLKSAAFSIFQTVHAFGWNRAIDAVLSRFTAVHKDASPAEMIDMIREMKK